MQNIIGEVVGGIITAALLLLFKFCWEKFRVQNISTQSNIVSGVTFGIGIANAIYLFIMAGMVASSLPEVCAFGAALLLDLFALAYIFVTTLKALNRVEKLFDESHEAHKEAVRILEAVVKIDGLSSELEKSIIDRLSDKRAAEDADGDAKAKDQRRFSQTTSRR